MAARTPVIGLKAIAKSGFGERRVLRRGCGLRERVEVVCPTTTEVDVPWCDDLGIECKRRKQAAASPRPRSRLRSTRHDKQPPSSPAPSRPRPARCLLAAIAATLILTPRISGLHSRPFVARAHAPLACICICTLRRHRTLTASIARVAYARPYFSLQCQQRRRHRRHEATSRGRRAELWAASCEEAQGLASTAAHSARPTHCRPHQHRLWRLWREQRLLRPATAPRNRDTVQNHWV
jgi:hypothetical protein